MSNLDDFMQTYVASYDDQNCVYAVTHGEVFVMPLDLLTAELPAPRGYLTLTRIIVAEAADVDPVDVRLLTVGEVQKIPPGTQLWTPK